MELPAEEQTALAAWIADLDRAMELLDKVRKQVRDGLSHPLSEGRPRQGLSVPCRPIAHRHASKRRCGPEKHALPQSAAWRPRLVRGSEIENASCRQRRGSG
jgi:hypothetical protein